MSQSSIPARKERSSISKLEQHRTHDDERRRRADDANPPRKEKNVPEPDQEAKPKKERIEEAERLMNETEAIDLHLAAGELAKISEDIIVERTESGFNTYLVTE